MSGAGDERVDEVWAALMALFVGRRDEMFGVLGDHGLTPPHGHALSLLLVEPQRMRDLASFMTCDASYITSLVDRLEELGLAERTADSTDRRVKVIALTDEGRAVAQQIRSVMTRPPVEIQRLSRSDRIALADLLAKIIPPGAPADPFRVPAGAGVRRR